MVYGKEYSIKANFKELDDEFTFEKKLEELCKIFRFEFDVR